MRVAVTGSAGFIGRHLVARLRAEGHRVVRVDVTGDDPVDVLDLPALAKAVDGVEAVYHLAAEAFVDAAHRDPVRAVELNVLGTVNVLEAARTVGADVLLASTVWAYGASDTLAASVVDETFPFSVERSGHVYTSSKLAAEMFACDYTARYGVRTTVLRLGIPYGPFMRSEAVLPRFVAAVLDGSPIVLQNGGTQRRQFVHVGDLATGLVAALRRPAEHAVYNLTSDEVVTIRQLAELVMDVSGRRVELDHRPGRPGDLNAAPLISAERARTHLGWRAATSLRDGVAEYWAWAFGAGGR